MQVISQSQSEQKNEWMMECVYKLVTVQIVTDIPFLLFIIIIQIFYDPSSQLSEVQLHVAKTFEPERVLLNIIIVTHNEENVEPISLLLLTMALIRTRLLSLRADIGYE